MDRKTVQEKKKQRRDVYSTFTAAGILMIIPAVVTIITYNVLNVCITDIKWTASDITRLYAVISAIMIVWSIVIKSKELK